MSEHNLNQVDQKVVLKKWMIEALYYFLVCVGSLTGGIWLTGFRPGNMENPVTSSDLLGSYMLAKIVSVQDNLFGYFTSLGFPYGQDWSLQPFTNLLGVFELKILSMSGFGPIESVHWVLILGFVLAGASSFFVLRFIGANPYFAVLLSWAFTLMPWHVFRMVHLWLANYWIIPLGILWVLVISNSQLVIKKNISSKRYGLLFGAVTIGILIGVQDSYYAVFLCILAVFGFVLNLRKVNNGIGSISRLIVLLSAPFSLAISIFLVQVVFAQTPHLYSPVIRTVGEQFANGGNLSSLFLPSWGFFGDSAVVIRLSQVIQNPNLPISENAEGLAVFSLLVAIASFLTALLVLVVLSSAGRFKSVQFDAFRNKVSTLLGLYVVSVAFFVTTGFGLFFGIIVSPQIRAWGRFSPIIAFISLCVLAIFLDFVLATIQAKFWMALVAKVVTYALVSALFVLSIGPSGLSRGNSEIIPELTRYSSSASANLKPGCPIFNYPPVGFPEGGLIEGPSRGDVYSDVLPFLYIDDHPFSFGAIKGQLGGLWYERISSDPVVAANQAKSLGFCAIQLDATKVDNFEKVYAELLAYLGSPIADANDQWYLFSLEKASVSEEYIGMLDVPEFWATKGFYLYEFDDHQRFWWSGEQLQSTAVMGNPSSVSQKILAKYKVELPPCLDSQTIQISSPENKFRKFKINVGPSGTTFSIKMELSPGEISPIVFNAANSCSTTSDIRVFSFRIFSPVITALKN